MSRHAIDHNGNARHMRGWKRQPHDPRDFQFSSTAPQPPILSLRSKMPAVRDQLEIGSCTANGGVVATEFCIVKETGKPTAQLSRLDLYATTRELEGTPLSEDSGCNVRDVFKASQKFGIADESLWPYITTRFDRSPPRRVMIAALHKRATSYHAANSLAQIKGCIAEGYPLIFGFDCFQSLMSPAVGQTGIIPLPTANDASIGGHCVVCMGYDDHRQAIEIQNSWGTTWGDHGFGWLPYEYVARNLASDFWTLRKEAIS